MNLLILTVSAGSGHIKASSAIEKYMMNNYPDTKVNTIDTLKYLSPIMDKIIVGGYLKTLEIAPKVYEKVYKYTEDDSSILNVSEIISKTLSIKMKEVIKEFEPDVILCTHPTPLEIVSILKRKGKIDIPTVAVITDYTTHQLWLYEEIEAYVIANEDFKHSLIEKGIKENNIFPLGIPVDESFLIKKDKESIAEELKLDINKRTLLLMGGGMGLGDIEEVFKSLISSDLEANIIVCAGSNEALKNKLEKLSKSGSSKTVLILGYINNMDEILTVSDAIITKAGGLTVTECLIKNVPMIINSPIPGQEEENTEYLLNSGVAVRCNNSGQIVYLVNKLLNNEKRLAYMKDLANDMSKPNSTRDICELLVKLAGR